MTVFIRPEGRSVPVWVPFLMRRRVQDINNGLSVLCPNCS